MLLLIQDLKGRYPARLVKKAKFGNIHFEESSFVSVEKDKKTGSESIKKIVIPPQAKNDLKSRLMPLNTVKKLPEEEVKLLGNFVDLLNKALELDPAKRLTPKEALNVSYSSFFEAGSERQLIGLPSAASFPPLGLSSSLHACIYSVQ